MSQTIKLYPPNSLLFISDSEGGDPIDFTHLQTIMSNATCIAISCLAFVDGKTEVTLGQSKEVDPGWPPAFDGYLEIAKQSVIVSTSEREALLEFPVQSARPKVKVWVNRKEGPDKVIVGVDMD
jgi:hypothetical protein